LRLAGRDHSVHSLAVDSTPLDDRLGACGWSELFGHVFLQNSEGYWYLDVFGGSLELLWPNSSALQEVLDTDDEQDEFLLGGLAMAADRQGTALGASQVYDFDPPPVLGGPFDVANMAARDFV